MFIPADNRKGTGQLGNGQHGGLGKLATTCTVLTCNGTFLRLHVRRCVRTGMCAIVCCKSAITLVHVCFQQKQNMHAQQMMTWLCACSYHHRPTTTRHVQSSFLAAPGIQRAILTRPARQFACWHLYQGSMQTVYMLPDCTAALCCGPAI